MTRLNGIPIAVLSGPGKSEDEELFKILSGAHFDEVEELLGLGKIPGADKELEAIFKHLVSTRDYIQKNPGTVTTSGGAAAHLQMLNYAIDNWNTPNRDKALQVLEQEEERWNEHNGMSGAYHDEEENQEINGLGAPKGLKKFWGKVKEAAKKAGEGLKNVGKALIRFNPLTLAVRGGFLLVMKINLFDMAIKLFPAYLTEAEAKAKGVSSDRWEKSKHALKDIEHLFADVLQGKRDKLKNAITTGRAKRHFAGFGNLGEPATIATVAASATAIIAALKTISNAGLHGTDDAPPAENPAPADNAPAADEVPADKAGFITMLKKWWKKSFGHEKATAPVSISEADKQPSNENARNLPATNEKTSTDVTNTDTSNNTENGTWGKIKQFVKDNPKTVAIGAVAVGTVITLAVVHHVKKKEKKAQAALSGAGKKKKRKKNKPKPPQRLLEANILH